MLTRWVGGVVLVLALGGLALAVVRELGKTDGPPNGDENTDGSVVTRPDPEVIQALEAMGGRVSCEEGADGRTAVVVDFSWSQLQDEGLKKVVALGEIESLDLTRTEVTDLGLKELAKLKRLRKLALDSPLNSST
jgi:hypothetical protein